MACLDGSIGTQLGSADTLLATTQLSLCIVGRLDAEAATSPRETFEKIYRNTVRVEKIEHEPIESGHAGTGDPDCK